MADARFKVVCSSILSPLDNTKRKEVLINQEAVLYDVCFLIQDRSTGRPLDKVPYKISLDNGISIVGNTDSNGLTDKISGDSTNVASLVVPYASDCESDQEAAINSLESPAASPSSKVAPQVTTAPDSVFPSIKTTPVVLGATKIDTPLTPTTNTEPVVVKIFVVAPWMAYAIEEAKRFKGEEEPIIEKSMNYHKLIKTGQATLVGESHAWCAAFVNWCLMTAGYEIDNPTFSDHTAAKGRAHGFYEVEGEKVNKSDKHGPIVRNPLFVQIEKPIWGAIAILTTSAGHGHHAGFVYARAGDNVLILLGGNQDQRIKFSPFVKKSKGQFIRYFVPKSYYDHLGGDLDVWSLLDTTDDSLNSEFEINVGSKSNKNTSIK